MAQRRFTSAKILILGGAGVGKTAFTVRYITKRYIGDYAPNTDYLGSQHSSVQRRVGHEKRKALHGYVEKDVQLIFRQRQCYHSEMMYSHKVLGSRDDITLEMLDTASKMAPDVKEKHIRWAEGLILMYSVTDRISYQEACKLKDDIFSVRGADVPLVLVSNKHDLLTARAVTEDECDNLAGEMDCPRFQISVAESQDGVSEVMEEMLVLIKRQLVKSLMAPNPEQVSGLEKKSRLYNMKKAFKKRIVRSRSDTF